VEGASGVGSGLNWEDEFGPETEASRAHRDDIAAGVFGEGVPNDSTETGPGFFCLFWVCEFRSWGC